MPKPFRPIMSGEIPYYMSAIGMSGARFAEGDPNDGKPAGAPSGDPKPGEKPAEDSKPNEKPDEDKFDGEGGPKALKAERERAAKAEKDLADAKAALQKIEDDKLSDIDKANKVAAEAQTALAAAQLENARLAALATHPVPKEYQGLVHGTDAASFEASAKLASELAAKAAEKAGRKPGYVPNSGTDGGDSNLTGGSVAAGRDRYESRKNK